MCCFIINSYQVIDEKGLVMEVIGRVEQLIFEKTSQHPSLQLLQNKIVVIQAKCEIEVFTDHMCLIKTPSATYRISGKNLSLSEYADFSLQSKSDGIQGILVEGGVYEK